MEEISLELNIASDPTSSQPIAGGELRPHEFTSRVFRNKRMLRIWTPPEYGLAQNSGRRYPVFYLNDGQNLFESSTSFTGVEWRVGETAGRMIEEKLIPPMIFVGIDNARLERIREYLPYRSLNPLVLRPRGELYPAFLIKEVMPFLRRHYRIAKSAGHTALGGSSLGGLISLYTVIAAPGMFGHVLLEGPCFCVGRRA